MSSAQPQAIIARQGDNHALAAALVASRRDTLATFAVCERLLENLAVPPLATLNPPLWELGHIGWFAEYWIARHPQRNRGSSADPQAPRTPGVRAQADALYDSSRVAHATRWDLPLPDAQATRNDLGAQMEGTLALLRETNDDDAALYFFRLALLHEDMHHEAALAMAQSQGLEIDDPRWQPRALTQACGELSFDAGPWQLGCDDAGFAFDNERPAQEFQLSAVRIDSRVVCWAQYLPFVEAGGYQPMPRYLRHQDGVWQQWRHGEWQLLNLRHAACHLTAVEAEAWCHWAGRRLPTEAEWERAAVQQPHAFEWGHVWEWTTSNFGPYPGFDAHPYRDYSAPWFGNHRVLRGASFMTQPRMRHPRYRNFFMPHRNDIAAGFRSCAM
jgi:gamma-glutamyl hercynylcysteine S-oxide synthase